MTLVLSLFIPSKSSELLDDRLVVEKGWFRIILDNKVGGEHEYEGILTFSKLNYASHVDVNEARVSTLLPVNHSLTYANPDRF